MAGPEIYCTTCGLANSATAGFCTNCGATLQTQAGMPAGPQKSPVAAIAIAVLSAALVATLVYFLVIKKDPAGPTGAPIAANTAATPAAGAPEEDLQKGCISNMKQVSVALAMYTADYDDMYPAAYSEDSLMPYIKDKEKFVCPKTKEHYSFNSNLLGMSTTAVAVPDNVIVFYEGTGNTLSTPHLGTGVIGFADTHVKAASDASKHFWRPDQGL